MSIYQVPEEDMTEEQRKATKRAVALREQNFKMNAELESMGANIEIMSARHDFTLSKLLEMRIITLDQYNEINLQWEEHLREQLQTVLRQLRPQYKEALRRADAARRGITTPRPSKLIVPGR